MPIVAHARDLTDERAAYKNPDSLPKLISLPEDIDSLPRHDASIAREIVRQGIREGVDKGYVACARKKWWSIRPPRPAPILMTYMSRRTPTFVLNEESVSMLNVVHGIYPEVPLSGKALERLVDYLNHSVSLAEGRTYAGGLVKYEPKEVEATIVPSPDLLERGCRAGSTTCLERV